MPSVVTNKIFQSSWNIIDFEAIFHSLTKKFFRVLIFLCFFTHALDSRIPRMEKSKGFGSGEHGGHISFDQNFIYMN